MFGDWNVSLKGFMSDFGGLLMVVSAIVLVFGSEPRGKNAELYDKDYRMEKKSSGLSPCIRRIGKYLID